jgi:hypothetical protein
MEQKISVSTTKFHTTMMPSKLLQNISLPYVVFPAEELYNDRVGDSSSKDDGDESDLESAKIFGQIHASYDTVKSVFYMHSTGGHNRQNILNFELVLFHVKCKGFNQIAVNYISLETKVIFLQALMQLFVFIVFLGLHA